MEHNSSAKYTQEKKTNEEHTKYIISKRNEFVNKIMTMNKKAMEVYNEGQAPAALGIFKIIR